MIGVSVDRHATSRDLKDRLEIPFPLLEDPDARLAALYGVAMHDDALAIPAAFIIGTDGAIRWEFIGERPPDLPTIDALLTELTELAPSPGVAPPPEGSFPELRPLEEWR